MNRTETVKAIIWLDQLATQAKAEAAKLRGDLSADARAEYKEQGTAPTWRIPDLATVSATVAHARVVVSAPLVFARWVAKRYPGEVVPTVRPAFQTAFLDRVVGSVDVVADPATGEVVPGLSIVGGGELSGISIRLTPAAREVFAALARTGLERLAVEAGPAVPVILAEVADAHL